MASSRYDYFILRFLRWLEKKADLVCPLSLKAEVHTLRLKASFLLVFLSCRGENNNIENRHLQALLVHIKTVFQSADLDIRRFWEDFIRISSKNSFWLLPVNMDDLLSSVLQRLELLKPDINEVYTILSKSSRSATYRDSEAAMKNLNSLVENIEDMLKNNAETVASVKEELEAAQKSLIFLRDLLAFTARRCSKMGKLKDLITHAGFLVDKMSCLLYMCSANKKMNESMVNEMKMHLSSELQNFSPAKRDVSQIYIKALKASKSAQGDSAVVDEFDWSFLGSLRDSILHLPYTKPSFMATNKDQILSLHEDLQLLTISFAMYKSSDAHSVQFLHIEPGIPKLDQISSYFLERIGAVIVDMGCLIYMLHNNEQNGDEAKEFKIAVSDLQDIIKIAKEDARKAYDTYIPKSWRSKTKFRRTNAKGIVRSLMKISERMRRVSSIRDIPEALIPHGLSGPLYELLQKELLSLTEAFRKLNEKQQVEHEEIEIQVMRLNDIRNETENLVSSFSHGSGTFWSRNLWLFVLIEEIKMIKMEFEDLQNKMVHDTSASKFTRKTNVEVKKTAIDYPVISEDEAEKIGKQMITGSKRSNISSINVSMHGIEDQMRWLETNLDLVCPLKNEVKELRFRGGFLKVFLSFKGNWHVEDGNLRVLLIRIRSVFQNANQDLQRLWEDMIQISPKEERCLPVNMDCLVSRVISRFRLLKPDIQEVYTILSESSRFITVLSDEAVMENLKSLLDNIEDLLRCNVELAGCVKEQLEVVRNRLRFLRNLLGFIAKRCSKLGKLKDLLIHTEFLADSISCLLYLCCVDDEMNDWTVNKLKMSFLSELQKFSSSQPDVREIYIRALKASHSAKGNSTVMDEFDLGFLDSLRGKILELSNTNISFITCNKDQILSLLDKLKFLITFFAMDKSLKQHSEHDPTSNYLFERINAPIIDIGFVIYSLNDDEKNEEMARELELNKKISDLEAVISVTKDDTRKMYDVYVPKSLWFNYPKTNGQGFIASLFRNLKELLNTKADLIVPLEHHIEIVQTELLSLREDFSKISKQHSQCEELQSQWTHFLDIAYQTEYVIDSFLGGDRPLYRHKLGLFNVIEDIKTIKIELKAIENKMTDDPSVHKPSFFSTQISVESKNNAVMSSKERPADEESTTKLVIFGEKAQKIRETLTNGLQKLHIISIVGMPGIGKTTLADSVFQHSSVTYHFHVQARCSVSQVHDKRRLLLEILQQVTAERTQAGDDDNDDLDQKVYQSLKGRRYLILMDDVWNIQPWEDIKVSFPDDENGSRIIFTSRFEDIASQTQLGSTRYHLSPLSEEKCWEMLQVKLFGNRSCPPELVMVGREIAANCKGLPLTVDLIAGILRVKERKNWKNVAESLAMILLEDPQGQCRKVLELSYKNLPDDLKSCFLYFAAFPEDEDVPTRKLILLWIAEGFVQLGKEDELESIEEAAEDILNNLISRSLVTVSRRGPLGGVDASRVHDLLHEFAVAKAQEESFMLKIDGKAKFLTLSSSSVHDQWREQYRMCIYPDNWVQFLESNPSGPRTRALISSYSQIESSFSLNFNNFKLLRVLHITQVVHGYCPAMFTLIHLRVLAIEIFENSDAFDVILEIHKLQKLESFIMERALSRKPHFNLLLDKICNMLRLRHFCFGGYISFTYLREEIWLKAPFANLRTLYNLKASYEEDVEKILKLMPNLVELKVLFYSPDEDFYPFPRLDFLKKLESLEVTHDDGYHSYPCKIVNFPPCLKILVISNFGMPWTEISEIGNHEYLEVLKLRDAAFVGPIWDMIDGQFPKLKYLSLDGLDIVKWNAFEDHVSCLEQVHVEYCTKLKELPCCLAEIATLQVINLSHCSVSTESSARRIKEEQEETGNEQLMIKIV